MRVRNCRRATGISAPYSTGTRSVESLAFANLDEPRSACRRVTHRMGLARADPVIESRRRISFFLITLGLKVDLGLWEL